MSLDAEGRCLVRGDWVLAYAQQASRLVRTAMDSAAPAFTLDASGLTRLDTAGAMLLLELLRSRGLAAALERVSGLDHADTALLTLVADRVSTDRESPVVRNSLRELLARLGRSTLEFVQVSIQLLGFVGLVLSSLGGLLTGRRKLRITSTVFHMEQAGLDAVPIVALLTFLVGAVVAFVGATALRDLGAEILTVWQRLRSADRFHEEP